MTVEGQHTVRVAFAGDASHKKAHHDAEFLVTPGEPRRWPDSRHRPEASPEPSPETARPDPSPARRHPVAASQPARYEGRPEATDDLSLAESPMPGTGFIYPSWTVARGRGLTDHAAYMVLSGPREREASTFLAAPKGPHQPSQRGRPPRGRGDDVLLRRHRRERERRIGLVERGGRDGDVGRPRLSARVASRPGSPPRVFGAGPRPLPGCSDTAGHHRRTVVRWVRVP